MSANKSELIRWELTPYINGRVMDIGCGALKCFPHFIGVDDEQYGGRVWVDVVSDTGKLDVFSTASFDAVFSSYLLQRIAPAKLTDLIIEWARVVKSGGHLILYLPAVETEKQEWLPSYDSVVAAFGKLGIGWDLCDYQVRDKDGESGLFFVFRIEPGNPHRFSWKMKKPEKTCAIVRFGAQGDMIQMSSILPWLKAEGYHVTVYCQAGLGYESVKHDPHIDRFIKLGQNQIPPALLGEWMADTKKKYSKWVNLCESVEGTLLAAPGRANWEWPNELRAKYMDRNYVEWTHELAGVPPPYQPKFCSTLEERAWAKDKARSYGRRNILWSLSGSSGHKVWPHLDAVVAAVMLHLPDTHIVMVGDELCQVLEVGWEGERRVHRQSGKWTIRQSMAFAEQADLLIGTETGLLNAMGHADTSKIITLSHSSHEMLTKHWKNTIVLEQENGCHKHPCRQLHGHGGVDAWADCPRHDETGTALCQFNVTPDRMFEAIVKSLGSERMAA